MPLLLRPKHIKIHAVLASLILCPSTIFANVDVATITAQLPPKTTTGFIAKNLPQNKIIADYQGQTFMIPASTQKVFTALAAKLSLGNNFRFETALLTDGSIKGNELQGNLIVRFTGDPELTSGQLYKLIAQLKEKGIKKIQGDIILDTSVFTSHDKAPGWVWNDLSMCFSSPPAAVNIDGNCFSTTIDANQEPGQFAKISVPSHFPMQVFSQIKIVDKSEAGYCRLDAITNDNNRYQIKGCMTRLTKPFGLSFAVQDPSNYAAYIIQNQLKNLGIAFHGQVKQPMSTQKGTVLAQHFSANLAVLVKKMLKKSDNQIADALFRYIAYKLYNRPASFQAGSLAIKHVLRNQAGIKFDHSVIADGSGLSRYNLIDPQTMLEALEYIFKHNDTLQLMDNFPKAGVDGTLSGRGSMIKPPLVKNVSAKTGALKGVYNLAGFMTNAKGEQIAFVQFINGYSTGDLESKTIRAPLVNFENRVYNALYQYQ